MENMPLFCFKITSELKIQVSFILLKTFKIPILSKNKSALGVYIYISYKIVSYVISGFNKSDNKRYTV